MASERITVSLPGSLLRGIDRRSKNRSEFVQRAVRHEFQRELTSKLEQSLDSPHPESRLLEDETFAEWFEALPAEAADLGDPAAGTGISWEADRGWKKV